MCLEAAADVRLGTSYVSAAFLGLAGVCLSVCNRQNGVSSSRLHQVREYFFSVDFALDLAISDLQLLLVCEGKGVAVPAPRYGQRLLAVECACLHYHLEVGVTGDQTLSMDVEVITSNTITLNTEPLVCVSCLTRSLGALSGSRWCSALQTKPWISFLRCCCCSCECPLRSTLQLC